MDEVDRMAGIWIEAWRKATGKPDTLPDYGEMLGWLCGQIEAAEARVVELAGALDKIAHSGPVDQEGNDDAEAGWSWCYDVARAALITTPAEALERARAVEKVLKWARQLIAETAWIPAEECDLDGAGPGNELVSALAKLDALGKEEE